MNPFVSFFRDGHASLIIIGLSVLACFWIIPYVIWGLNGYATDWGSLFLFASSIYVVYLLMTSIVLHILALQRRD